MASKQHAQFSDENGNLFYLESETEDVLDASGNPLSNGGDLSEASVKFTADTTRKLPQSGGRFKAFCGSVVKFLSDIKTVGFTGSYNDLSNKPSIPSGAAASQAVANNCTTTAAGSVLDARQGKVLMDKANQLNSEIAKVIRFDDEGTNIDITSPDGIQWEIDAYNNNLRAYTVDSKGVVRSISMTTEGDIVDSYGNTMRGLQQSFQGGVNALRDKCISCGVTPTENTPAGVSNAIQEIYNNRYNEGYSAGQAASEITCTDISSKLTAYASQNHGFRSSESLAGYKYIVVCAIYQSGKTASFSSFSGCSCLKQISWTANGETTTNPVSVHLVILTNITGAINVSASSVGTGNVSVRAFGLK